MGRYAVETITLGENALSRRQHCRHEPSARMQKFATELVALAPDVILAPGSSSTGPLLQATRTTFGHLTELNGKFKMRATEFTFAPGAYLGAHHHIGPGVRYILSGELTFTEGGVATIYKTGDYYFETGNLAHTAENKTDQPLRILIVEILPKDWTGPAVIPPRSQ